MAADVYGDQVRRGLQRVLRKGGLAPEHADAVKLAVKFLATRLTAAARAGCHHCHEGARGTPCWWCGLKNK